MTVAVQRAAASLLALVGLVAATASVLLGEFWPVGGALGSAGIALAARWAGRRRLIRFLYASAGLLAVSVVAMIAYLLLPGSGADPSPAPRVSIRYSGQVEATGSAPVLTETVVWDEQSLKNLQAAFPARTVNLSAVVPPRDWHPAGRIDGAPVYTRATSLAPFGGGWFGVDQATVHLSLGYASLHGSWFEMVPAEGSPLAIRTRKGAIGNSDPAADQVTDLPGRPARQSTMIRMNPLRGAVTVDVLGSALRNPAGRLFYDAWSWGWPSWLLSFLTLTCAAVAADLIKERIRTVMSRRTTPPGDTPPPPAPGTEPAGPPAAAASEPGKAPPRRLGGRTSPRGRRGRKRHR